MSNLECGSVKCVICKRPRKVSVNPRNGKVLTALVWQAPKAANEPAGFVCSKHVQYAV